MDIGHKAADAALYTDFNQLTRLRADATKAEGSEESKAASKEVASQIEALFFQMVLKSMRDANSIGETSSSDQTRFYQDMFDKQITLELSKNNKGNGTGLAATIEQQISGVSGNANSTNNIELIRTQIRNQQLNNTMTTKPDKTSSE